LIISSCNVVKRVGENDHLLTHTSVYINEKKTTSEEITNLIYQKPNSKLLGFPLRLHIYNLARQNIDSILEAKIYNNPKKIAWKTKVLSKKQLDKDIESRKSFNKWLKTTGEAPVIVDTIRTRKSKNKLDGYYFANGWFDVKTTSKTTRNDNKRDKAMNKGILQVIRLTKPELQKQH
ncbi:MAG: hypothetical protein JKX93_13810, partial [Rhizobiaceae bacterium]|nr:hypothetical protein [Rhizobiaceae bacterium]